MMVKTSKKSSINGGSSTTKLPPKPYTEYTIFFRLEQTYLLQTTTGTIDEEILAVLDPNHYDALEFPRPPKYQSLSMPPYWYSSAQKAKAEKKRKHRKREGRIDLKTLSKTISTNWRNADSATIQYCRKLAKAEQKKYDETVKRIETQNRLDEEAKAELELLHNNNYANAGGGEGLYPNVPSPTSSSSSSSDNLNLVGSGSISMSEEQLLLSSKLSQLSNNQGQDTNSLFLGGLDGMPQLPFNTTSTSAPTIDSNHSNSNHPTVALNNNNKNNLKKRKFGNRVRRASAPPEFMVGMLQRPNINTMKNGNQGNMNMNSFQTMSSGLQQRCQPITNNSNINTNYSILPSSHDILQGLKDTFRTGGLDVSSSMSNSLQQPFPTSSSLGTSFPMNVTSSPLNATVVSLSSSQHTIPDNNTMMCGVIPSTTANNNAMFLSSSATAAAANININHNMNFFHGDDQPPKLAHRIKRRASVGPAVAPDLHQVSELKRSFQEELNRHGCHGNVNVQDDFDNYFGGSSYEQDEAELELGGEGEEGEESLFLSVPKWDKEDADALLEVLS